MPRHIIAGHDRDAVMLFRKVPRVEGVLMARGVTTSTRRIDTRGTVGAQARQERTARPAVAPRVPEQPVHEQTFDADVLRRLLPPYRVVVLNNDHNTFDEVIKVLVRAVPGMDRARAEVHAHEIHSTGSTVPFTGPQERAEAVAATIRTIGIVVRVEPD